MKVYGIVGGLGLIMMTFFIQRMNAQGIEFVNDSTWRQITQRSFRENKPVFIDCYATWCGPCKWMAKNVFTNDTVGKYFNQHFINVKMNMEKGEGKEIAEWFNIKSYPTFLFLDVDGTELHRVAGSQRAADFIKSAGVSFDEEKRFSTLKKRYQNGERNPGFLRLYIQSASAAGMDTREVIAWYNYFITDAEFTSAQNADFLLENIWSVDLTIYKRILSSPDAFIQYWGIEKWDEVVTAWAYKSFENCMKQERVRTDTGFISKQILLEDRFNVFMHDLKKTSTTSTHTLVRQYYLNKFIFTHDVKNALEYARTEKPDDYESLNSIAWLVYENSNDKNDLERALELAKKSVAIKLMYMNADTYAALLYKLNHKKEAKRWAEKAIKLGKTEGTDVSATETLLQEINAMK